MGGEPVSAPTRQVEALQVTSGADARGRADRFPGLWRRKDGSLLLIDNFNTGARHHADMSQWVAMPDGSFMVAYSLPPSKDSEVRVRTARFTLDSFQGLRSLERP